MQNGVIDFVIIKNEPFVIELNPFNDYQGAGINKLFNIQIFFIYNL